MEILSTTQEAPAPLNRINYAEIAEAYNEMSVGSTLRMDKVYNITTFRQALERRGITAGDATVFHRGNKCLITKQTDARMAE